MLILGFTSYIFLKNQDINKKYLFKNGNFYIFIGEDAEEKARWFARTEYGIIEAINIEDIPAYALAEQQSAVPKIQNSDGLQ